jgi:hypothetical protein
MQSLQHQSIIRILSSFWTYRLLDFNENIEKTYLEQGYNKIVPFDPLSLNNIPDTCVGNVNKCEHSLCKIANMNTSALPNK